MQFLQMTNCLYLLFKENEKLKRINLYFNTFDQQNFKFYWKKVLFNPYMSNVQLTV